MVDPDLMGQPHVVGVEEVLAVQPDVSDGGQPVEFQLPGSGARVDGSLEAAPEPPVPTVEELLVLLAPRPGSLSAQGGGGGPRDGGSGSLPVVARQGIRAGHGIG